MKGWTVLVLGLLAWSQALGQSITTPLENDESRLRAPVVGNADSVYHKHETLINVQFSKFS